MVEPNSRPPIPARPIGAIGHSGFSGIFQPESSTPATAGTSESRARSSSVMGLKSSRPNSAIATPAAPAPAKVPVSTPQASPSKGLVMNELSEQLKKNGNGNH